MKEAAFAWAMSGLDPGEGGLLSRPVWIHCIREAWTLDWTHKYKYRSRLTVGWLVVELAHSPPALVSRSLTC